MNKILTAVLVTGVTGSMAIAQNTPPPNTPPQTTPPTRTPPGANAGQAAPANGAYAPPTDPNTSYQKSGGSLYRMDYNRPNGNASTEASSVFAVRPPDPKRIKKFDLLTVIVREESDSTSKSNSDLKKSNDFNAILQSYFDLTKNGIQGRAPLANQPQLQFQLERNFKGEGTVDRSDTMTARVQAQVIDVKPNGVLIIQATKQIKNDEEELKFTLTGMVRAEDVTIDNSVLSTQLADLQLEKVTKGSASDTSKRGLIPKFFDWINPF